MYVGEMTEQVWSPSKSNWFLIHAVLEIGNPVYPGKIASLFPTENDPLVFIFGEDGDSQITEDKYGRKLRAIPVHRVIRALEEDDDDRRAYSSCYYTSWVLECIKTIVAAFERNPLSIVIFGH